MSRFEEDVKIQSSLIALELLKHSGHDGSRETGCIPDKRIGLSGRTGGRCFLRRRSIALAFLAASNHQHVAGNRDVHSRSEAIDSVSVDRKPTSRIQQVAGFIANRSQLQTLHWTIVGTLENTRVVESQRCGIIL